LLIQYHFILLNRSARKRSIPGLFADIILSACRRSTSITYGNRFCNLYPMLWKSIEPLTIKTSRRHTVARLITDAHIFYSRPDYAISAHAPSTKSRSAMGGTAMQHPSIPLAAAVADVAAVVVGSPVHPCLTSHPPCRRMIHRCLIPALEVRQIP